MDRRAYILPVISVFLVLALFTRPDITGFMVAGPFENRISADISIKINQDGFVPEDSLVTIYLGDRSSPMDFKEFIEKTGKDFERLRGEIPEINYEGYGFGGENAYSLDISEFDLDTTIEPGNYTLIVEVGYENYVISHTSQNIEV
jgi:hypothetical protein